MYFENLKELIKRDPGTIQKSLAEELGTTEKTVSQWVNGRVFPNGKYIQRLLCRYHTLIVKLDNGKTCKITVSP